MEVKKRHPINLEIGDLITVDEILDIRKFVTERQKKDPQYSLQRFTTEAIVKYACDLGIIEGELTEEE